MKDIKIYDLHILLDHKSNQKLKWLSKKSKCTKSEIVRRLINDFVINEKPDEKFYDVLSDLIKIRDELQIVAEKSEYLNEIDKEKYFDNVKKINEFIAQIKLKYL